jgi:2-(1,2-epoxy-1,2-dihydrophenyl)acetyl-CoA isomerase
LNSAAAAEFETILLREVGGCAHITLNRPERLNAMTRRMHADLMAALDRAEALKAAAVVLTGAGRAFCAGQDLSDIAPEPGGPAPDVGALVAECYNPLVERLGAMNAIVVCAVNGVAAGAGANIALACDLVIAKRSAVFIQSFRDIGLVPDAGGTWNLGHKVGLQRALGLALLGEPLDAASAEAWGLIWKSVSDELFAHAVQALVDRLTAGPRHAQALTKHAVRSGLSATLPEQLRSEAALQGELCLEGDFAEGVAAFQQKRLPLFAGS